MPSPGVTIIIPAYNAERTIRDCLASVLAAEHDGPREVLVVDDGSTDDTCAIAESLGCRVLRTERNGGPALARNLGAAAATGEILIFVDADTRMRADSIREAVRALEEEGVDAVTGMYEAEPLNGGFFPAYYAYLKYHAFVSAPTRRIQAFGAQCAAIRKSLLDRVGGYRSIPWGMDIENEELGHRINRYSPIALSREFRVHHNFPGFRKLLYVFTTRVFWFVLFRRYCGRDETVLLTRRFGVATAALPAALVSLVPAVALSVEPLNLVFRLAAALGIAAFVWGYGGFWWLCTRRRGILFGAAAAPASAFFATLITASAIWGHLVAGWFSLRKQDLPFAQKAVGRT